DHLSGRLVLRGRQPVVCRRDRPAPARRHHRSADLVAEPADLPAGGVVPGASLTGVSISSGVPPVRGDRGRGPAREPVPVRLTAAGPLRPRRGAAGGDARRAPFAAGGPVAVPRAAAGG